MSTQKETPLDLEKHPSLVIFSKAELEEQKAAEARKQNMSAQEIKEHAM